MKVIAIAAGLCLVSGGAALAIEAKSTSDQLKALVEVQKAQELTDAELAKIEGQAITTVVLNPGGNTPQGGGALNGQAITSRSVNLTGYAPPGQNK
jgi:hypothetical protein